MLKAFHCSEVITASQKSSISAPNLHIYSSNFRISLGAFKVVPLINVGLDLLHTHTEIALDFYREKKTDRDETIKTGKVAEMNMKCHLLHFSVQHF